MKSIKRFVWLLGLLMVGHLSNGQDLVQSGPMVGYSTMREVMLWVQTNERAEVYIEYFTDDAPQERFQTEKVQTVPQQAYVARLLADQVQPGKTYQYEVVVNGKPNQREYPFRFKTQTLWQWRTDPPEVTFVIGSCNYVNEIAYDRPGKPYGGNFEIFQSIFKKKPEFMLWMGDNTYLREADWNSRTGFLHRYTHTRSLPELQPLLASTHHYAIWDDHDYGPNDADGSFWLKETAAEVFKLFWANPNYNMTREGDVAGTFQWADIQFFLLDNRTFRTANRNRTTTRQMLGKPQIDWLINALSASQAPFKFVVMGGQVLSTEAMHENYATFPEERHYLLSKIREAKIEGVIFLDGDRHHTVLSKMQEAANVYPLYDLTCSSLTAGAYPNKEEQNAYKITETLVGENNFGLLRVTGPRTDRQLSIQICNKDGKMLWEQVIKASELVYPE